MMGEVMYFQQALRQPDANEFVQAVIKEVNGHVDWNNWTLKKRTEVPDDIQIDGYVVGRLDMYRTKVLLYRTMVLLARPTKVRR